MNDPCPMLPPHPLQSNTARGFTAIELMVVIAIVATLTALAAPSFRPIIEKWRIRDAADNFTSALYVARTEAIKRGGRVVLRKNPLNAQDCPSSDTIQDWGCGWFLYVDVNNNEIFDAGTDVMLQKSPPLKSLLFTNKASNVSYYKFDRWGKAGVTAMGFTLLPLPDGVSSPYVTTLCISSGGRVQRQEGDVACQ